MIKQRNKFLKDICYEFIVACYEKEIIKFDYNLISLDNTNFFNINLDTLYGNKKIQTIYTSIFFEISTIFFIDKIFVFTDILSMNYNSILAYSKNIDLHFLDRKMALKKQIYNINELNNQSGSFNILFPLFFTPSKDKFNHILNWLNILKKILNIDRIFVVSIFENNSFDMSILNNYNKENNSNLVYYSLLDKNEFFDILNESKQIDSNMYKKVKMFIDDSKQLPSKSGSNLKIIQNKLFLKVNDLIEKKKSKLCISLDYLENPEEIIKFTNLLGNYIIAIKINSNHIFSEVVLNGLKKLANHYDFLILDDKQLSINSMDDLKKINIFKWMDAVSINFNFISEEIETWINLQRSTTNKNASFILNYRNATKEDEEIMGKQYLYFNKYLLGIIGCKDNDNSMFSIVSYNDINRLNDDFKTLINSDLILMDKELYKSKNPIEVVSKINDIIFK
jgi:hypothetical protein